MCGICGVVVIDGPPPDRELVTRMIGRLRHRGPDGSGLYRDNHAALGHTRLAIIDTEGGAQPLCNEDETVWISFNGEIFNYVELGEELRRCGHRFRTASDTEVIVHAWEEWGEQCFTRFNGQWAVALWDSRERRLVLSRDRMGVRPLFYTRDSRRLAFASEVKALMADPAVPRALDPTGLDEVLTYWSTVAPRTIFRGIEQLEPGYVAVLDRDGFRRHPYFSVDFPDRGAEPEQDIEANAAELRERLVEAARLRFVRSDVPVGAYLSGGIDSSITAAVIARYTDAPLHTFSLRFTDAEYDEGVHQHKMVAELGARHEEVMVSPADVAEVFPEVVRHTETPVLRTAPAPLLLLSRLVRDNGYKVVVTGEGADEVLGGYDIFREGRVRAFWARDPGSATRDRAVELLYPWMERNPGTAPAFARSFFGQDLDAGDPAISHRPRWASTSAVKALLSPDVRAELDRGPDVVTRMPAGSDAWDPLSRAQWLEMTTLLPGYILSSQGDRMLMASSVEGRFPFLDKDVIELANRLPARHKLCGLDEKHLLKIAFADLVPEQIRARPKQPYRSPDTASFFSGPPPEWLTDVTSPAALADAGVFAPRPVAGLLAKAARTGGVRAGNTDNMRLLAVLSTQLLHQQLVVDGGTASDAAPPAPMTVIDRVQHVRSTA
ncbi:asparagine synthase (glutamine-hydrolyzing) [Nocardioides sp. zg-1230]|uniref:asparagine synthase (glutamine-hydrolyzing) n=1 Tax=Nocardioides sp. zg-1230 TaxID=2736601 RepID=UPI00155788D6|nr:asparagine synthase (glutamine-hydrolyzing) [Nocardioides sp. zg-1230]NPC40890.1 asparagine synthase (glutamine-hydrolyzing) [Nocardioides sp. zg-1230]